MTSDSGTYGGEPVATTTSMNVHGLSKPINVKPKPRPKPKKAT